jgi:hypothetical protein
VLIVYLKSPTSLDRYTTTTIVRLLKFIGFWIKEVRANFDVLLRQFREWYGRYNPELGVRFSAKCTRTVDRKAAVICDRATTRWLALYFTQHNKFVKVKIRASLCN